jgi:hypothetical protein
MTSAEERKLGLIRRIEEHRDQLARSLDTLRDDIGWVGGFLGGVNTLVSVKPRRWKIWMRILTFTPMAFRLLRRVFGKSAAHRPSRGRR